MSGWKGQREKLGEGREFHLVRFTDTSLGTLKNILLPGNFATILIFFYIYLAPFIWLDTSRKMGSLIFFFFPAHQLALLNPNLELQVLRQVMIFSAIESELPDSSSKNMRRITPGPCSKSLMAPHCVQDHIQTQEHDVQVLATFQISFPTSFSLNVHSDYNRAT